MILGLERCRECGCYNTDENVLTFGHIIPAHMGGKFKLDNLTILCHKCNQKQGTEVWSHLRSLQDENRQSG
jgi:5-methylcytosine-specific restriction endonuclease McrA